MALTEKYVTVTGAGDHNGTAEAHAWTFAEMIAAAPAAETRVNIKTGTYSVGAITLPANGTAIAPVVLRGYNSTIGDLDNQGRSDDGTLNTTNFPDITITGLWGNSAFCVLQNLDITGALSSYLIGSTTVDSFTVSNCRIVNTQNHSSAGCFQGDDDSLLANCDFACTGASHATVVDMDSNSVIVGCRFSGTVNSAILLQINAGPVVGCVFLGMGGTSVGVAPMFNSAYNLIANCTFYNLGTAIRLPNSAMALRMWAIVNDHVTDCAEFINNQYSATSVTPTLEMHNRIRDITTPYTGILSAVVAGELSTNTTTGDATTDYVSTTSLRLLYSAPGAGAGMMPYKDIGAYQHVPDFPAVGNVTEDDTVNGATGTFAVPTEAQVESGVGFGAGGTEFEGTFEGGGGASPVFGDRTGGIR
jgi:hypothetical protein